MVSSVIRPGRTQIEFGPSTTFEAITREKVENLNQNVTEIRSRVDTIFYLLIGSLLLDVVMGLVP